MIGRCVPAGVRPAGQDFGDVVRVAARLVLLVLLVEMPRVLAAIARATAAGLVGFGVRSCEFS